jgi:DNA-binding CsgD family transcriptional regulator
MVMSNDTTTTSVLGTAIRALGGDDFFVALETLIGHAVYFDNFLAIAYLGEQRPLVLSRRAASSLVHAEIEGRYASSLYVLDPFYSAHIARIPAGAYRLQDLSPDKFKTTSYYLEYYQKTTLIDEIAYFAYVANGWTINVCIGCDETSGRAFGKAAFRKAADMSDTVAALLEQHFRVRPIGERKSSQNVEEILIRELRLTHGIEVTARQAQIAVLLLRGHSSKSIARTLGISWQTVRVFRKQLYARCGVSSQAALFMLLMPLVRS